MDMFNDRLIENNDGQSGLNDSCGYCSAMLLICDQFILALDVLFTAIRGDATAASHPSDTSHTGFHICIG
jgi:hypothetical protein